MLLNKSLPIRKKHIYEHTSSTQGWCSEQKKRSCSIRGTDFGVSKDRGIAKILCKIYDLKPRKTLPKFQATGEITNEEFRSDREQLALERK